MPSLETPPKPSAPKILAHRKKGLSPEPPQEPLIPCRAPEEAHLRIRARINVGHGNNLAIQGSWDNWEKTTPMKCILPDLWEALIPLPPNSGLAEFKTLLNEKTWEEGINHAGYPDSTVEFEPRFNP